MGPSALQPPVILSHHLWLAATRADGSVVGLSTIWAAQVNGKGRYVVVLTWCKGITVLDWMEHWIGAPMTAISYLTMIPI